MSRWLDGGLNGRHKCRPFSKGRFVAAEAFAATCCESAPSSWSAAVFATTTVFYAAATFTTKFSVFMESIDSDETATPIPPVGVAVVTNAPIGRVVAGPAIVAPINRRPVWRARSINAIRPLLKRVLRIVLLSNRAESRLPGNC
jgi:hypothetical protein